MGPHALAREWVGTKLAHWFGMETFDIAILRLSAADEIILREGLYAAPGPAIVTRAVQNGHNWSGDSSELRLLENREAITRLVVFDTWTQNRDRHPPSSIDWRPNHDNVFFSPENAGAGRFRLIAMDHTECFVGPINDRMDTISRVKDSEIYGLFEAFQPLMEKREFFASIEHLRRVCRDEMMAIVETLPSEWEVGMSARQALIRLIVDRACHLADNLERALGSVVWPGEILFRGGSNGAD